VRIEARDESTTQEKATATAKTTAKTKTPLRKNKCKSKDKNLDNTSRLIEAPEGIMIEQFGLVQRFPDSLPPSEKRKAVYVGYAQAAGNLPRKRFK
jgi:hypothetical protein